METIWPEETSGENDFPDALQTKNAFRMGARKALLL